MSYTFHWETLYPKVEQIYNQFRSLFLDYQNVSIFSSLCSFTSNATTHNALHVKTIFSIMEVSSCTCWVDHCSCQYDRSLWPPGRKPQGCKTQGWADLAERGTMGSQTWDERSLRTPHFHRPACFQYLHCFLSSPFSPCVACGEFTYSGWGQMWVFVQKFHQR